MEEEEEVEEEDEEWRRRALASPRSFFTPPNYQPPLLSMMSLQPLIKRFLGKNKRFGHEQGWTGEGRCGKNFSPRRYFGMIFTISFLERTRSCDELPCMVSSRYHPPLLVFLSFFFFFWDLGNVCCEKERKMCGARAITDGRHRIRWCCFLFLCSCFDWWFGLWRIASLKIDKKKKKKREKKSWFGVWGWLNWFDVFNHLTMLSFARLHSVLFFSLFCFLKTIMERNITPKSMWELISSVSDPILIIHIGVSLSLS